MPDTTNKEAVVIELSDSDEEEEEEYDVEAIIGARGKGKKREYHVKWKNFPVSDATWEPAANLKADGCQDLIDAYENAGKVPAATAKKAGKRKMSEASATSEPVDVKPKVAKKGEAKDQAKPAKTPPEDRDQLLGHVMSLCVGIQHYRGNGVRYNKEPFRLRRQPDNPYDRNAVSVLSLPSLRQVGHVQRIDALAIAKVADDRSMTIRMVGQVESGCHQVYKFPLRISFFGPAECRERVSSLLRTSGVFLEAPAQRNSKSQKLAKAHAASAAASRAASSGGAAGGNAVASGKAASGKSKAAPAASEADSDDDEVEFTHEKTWAERDKELRAQAVVLE